MTRRGDPGWNYLMVSQTVTAIVLTIGGPAALFTDRTAVWVGVVIFIGGIFAFAFLAVVRRRGRY